MFNTMKPGRILMKVTLSVSLLSVLLFLNACEPPHCAWCYDNGWFDFVRDMEICTDNESELEDLVRVAEGMGYRCEYK
jgi:hypothetical protein